jgi:hypothetical protein
MPARRFQRNKVLVPQAGNWRWLIRFGIWKAGHGSRAWTGCDKQASLFSVIVVKYAMGPWLDMDIEDERGLNDRQNFSDKIDHS